MRSLFRLLVLKFIWRAARIRVAAEQPTIIAITGTVGKTSAKDAIFEVLSEGERPVVRTLGNMATETGLPLSLLGLDENPAGFWEWLGVLRRSLKPPTPYRKKFPFYVLEFAADKPGDIAFLAKHLPPKIAVITAITPVHMQFYKGINELIQEKMSLTNALCADGTVICNLDDANIRAAVSSRKLEPIWFGVRRPTQAIRPGIWIVPKDLGRRGLNITLEYVRNSRGLDGLHRKIEQLELATSCLGEHQLYALAAAAAVGLQFDIPMPKIKKALEQYRVPPGRGRLIAGKKGMTLIDDSYNASPEAMKAGLKMLRGLASDRRVVAILGNMGELGSEALQAHKAVAREAARCVDFLAVVGQYNQEMVKEAKAAGMSSHHILGFLTPEQCMPQIDQIVQRNDIVYIKASQNGMRFERLVKLLMLKPADAAKELVRQAGIWKES